MILPTAVWPAAAGLALFGLAVAVDRWREPRRDPRAPMAVVDARTFRYAQARIARLTRDDDRACRWALMHSMCMWLRGEVTTGPRRHRLRRARELEVWELRLEQNPLIPLS